MSGERTFMLEELDVFQGEMDGTKGRVYARLPLPMEPGHWRLTGRIRGPLSDFSQTLPSTATFVDLGSEPSVLSAATIIDPCKWLPENPLFYELSLSLERDGQAVAFRNRLFYFRDFATKGASFTMGGKRWVPRGVCQRRIIEPLPRWRDAGAVRVIRRIDFGLLFEASRVGSLTIVVPLESAIPTIAEMRKLASYPSVLMVVFPQNAAPPEDLKHRVPNFMIAQTLRLDEKPSAWADVAWMSARSIENFARTVRGLELPIIAFRRGEFSSLAQARAAVDTLQADLAPLGQFAGYVV